MLKNLISICVLIGMIVGALSYFPTAKAFETYKQRNDLTIQQLGDSFETYKMEARYQWLDDQIFKLQEKYRGKQMPAETREQIHKYEQEYKSIERNLNK